MTTIAIAGATGAVGQQMLECLKERNIQANLKLLASARSKGKENDGHIVEELTKESFQGVDYVLGATGNDVTKMWMPWAKEAGCIVVDNSIAFRLDKDTGFEWIGEYDISADDLLSGDNRGQKIHVAKEFLQEFLVSGSVAQTKVAEEAEVRGIKKKTLWNAKKELEIDSVKIGNQWFWMLPE